MKNALKITAAALCCLALVACSQKGPAEAALKTAETSMNEVQADGAKYAVGLDLVHRGFGRLESGFGGALLAAGDEGKAAQSRGGDLESVLHSISSICFG